MDFYTTFQLLKKGDDEKDLKSFNNKFCNPDYQEPYFGRNLLDMTCFYGHTACVMTLLVRKANPNSKNKIR